MYLPHLFCSSNTSSCYTMRRRERVGCLLSRSCNPRVCRSSYAMQHVLILNVTCMCKSLSRLASLDTLFCLYSIHTLAQYMEINLQYMQLECVSTKSSKLSGQVWTEFSSAGIQYCQLVHRTITIFIKKGAVCCVSPNLTTVRNLQMTLHNCEFDKQG